LLAILLALDLLLFSKRSLTMTNVITIWVGLLAVLAGYVVMTSPPGVTPPFVPEGSPTQLLPPWFVFRPAVALNEFFKAAALATTPPQVQIFDMASAYFRSETLYALIKNGILDVVQESSKSLGCVDVATKLKLQEHAVCEYMRAGLLLGLLTNGKVKGEYSITPVGALVVKDDSPGSLRDFALMINEETTQAWRAAGTKGIASGESGFYEAFEQEVFPYHNDHPEQEAQFDRAMKSLSFSATGEVLSDWTLQTDAVFCDIGGGVGTAAAIVLDHYPDMKGMVFDQPTVTARSNEFLKEKGLSDRAKALGGDFFAPFQSDLAACDIFFMKFILHDWPDTESIEILKNIKAVAKPGAKVALAEFVMETAGTAMETAKALMSINMLASCKYGAKERNIEEYSALFKAAGFDKEPQLIPLRGLASVVEIGI
jgi:hypothetical protein